MSVQRTESQPSGFTVCEHGRLSAGETKGLQFQGYKTWVKGRTAKHTRESLSSFHFALQQLLLNAYYVLSPRDTMVSRIRQDYPSELHDQVQKSDINLDLLMQRIQMEFSRGQGSVKLDEKSNIFTFKNPLLMLTIPFYYECKQQFRQNQQYLSLCLPIQIPYFISYYKCYRCCRRPLVLTTTSNLQWLLDLPLDLVIQCLNKKAHLLTHNI